MERAFAFASGVDRKNEFKDCKTRNVDSMQTKLFRNLQIQNLPKIASGRVEATRPISNMKTRAARS